jgi:hypothetical protein
MKSALKVAPTAKPTVVSKYPAAKGAMGVLALLDPKDIGVDPKYQRGVNLKHAEKIAREWDWSVFAPVSVSRRPDGSIWSYDGQHRVVGAILREDIDVIPCYVVEMSGAQEEAAAFGANNRNRKRLKPIDEYRALAAAGDTAAVAIEEALKVYKIEPTSDAKCGVGKTTAINSMLNHMRNGDTLTAMSDLYNCLNVIKSAWGNQRQAFSGRSVEGMLRVLSRIENTKLLIDEAEERLGRYPVEEVLWQAEREAKAKGGAILGSLPGVIIEKFNYRRKNKLA